MKPFAALFVILGVAAFAGTPEAVDKAAKNFPPGSTDLVPESLPRNGLSASLGSTSRVANARQDQEMFYLRMENGSLNSQIEALKSENGRLKRELERVQVQNGLGSKLEPAAPTPVSAARR